VVDAVGSVVPDRFQRFQIVESWDDAERRCIGYEQSTLRDRGFGMTSRSQNSDRPTSRDLQFIAAAGICLKSAGPSGQVRVLDFGGASGHYFDVAAAAYPDVSWQWTVVETPIMASLAANSMAGRSISWTSDLDAALHKRWDFVLASASLNYVPEPLKALTALGRTAPYALLTRLPLWPVAHHLPAIQRLSRRQRAGAYPTWVFSEEQFLDEVEAVGDVVLRFDVPEDTARIAGHRGAYAGLLIRTKDPS